MPAPGPERGDDGAGWVAPCTIGIPFGAQPPDPVVPQLEAPAS